MSESPSLNPNGLPLRSALKTEDDNDRPTPQSSSSKVVQIAEPEQDPAPEPEPEPQACDFSSPRRQFSANIAKRLSGRPPTLSSCSSQTSMASAGVDMVRSPDAMEDSVEFSEQPRRKQQYVSQKLLSQVSDWLEHERRKKESRDAHGHSHAASRWRRHDKKHEGDDQNHILRSRTDSIDSNSSEVALDKLQRILEDNMSALGLDSIPRSGPRLSGRPSLNRHKKSSSRTLLQRAASSDTEYVDGDAMVPSCDAVLDNTKTLSYNAGKSSECLVAAGKAEAKEREAWCVFRNEIIRLTHTLRIKGWRQVPLDAGDRISVQRLSGALTNAVYVVTPPDDLEKITGRKLPNKLLLRIYGPQVEHLIDREKELSVLRRLARKKIGPRLLGTFTNGRFEQYFNSTTLTPENLREPETSRQIAKRMRELHDGIEVLETEREGGPAVWNNWDKWLNNVEKRVTPIDEETKANMASGCRKSIFPGQGFVCGVEWPKFRAMVEKYRAYLASIYQTQANINARMVFAHNDTQYGNILRVRPDDAKSPLLQPANEHKQLVVIDFEYASANVPGMEFANHFTEWMYDYHDAIAPHSLHPERFPRVEEQRRFVKAYVDHRPEFPHAGSTPRLSPLDTPTGGTTPAFGATSSSSSIVDFMLDARVPQSQWTEAERQREEQTDKMVNELIEEAKLWRPINSAFWIAWGLVQANVPGVDGCEEASDAKSEGSTDEDEDEEFDYLSYAQDRALFFWGDCVLRGLIKLEELPEDVRARLHLVDR